MNYGIPFRRPFTSPFGVPFLGITGGGSPSVPVGALATYTAYSPSNFTLVTDNKVNVWQDETTNGNDLTQSTSGNQPTLVEDNTVTQFTASNQPTFQKDKQVTQDTLASMPTYDATFSGLDFRHGGLDSKYMIGTIGQSNSDFTCEIVFSERSTGTNQKPLSYEDGSRFLEIRSSDTQVFIGDDLGAIKSFSGLSIGASGSLKVTLDGADMTVSDGINSSVLDVTGSTFAKSVSFVSGTVLGTSFDGVLNSIKFWNSADSSGAPDFELDASDPSTMLNDSSAEPQDGDSVRLWHDPSAFDVMAFDNRNTAPNYLRGLTPISGDFTYRMILDMTDNGSTQSLLGKFTEPVVSQIRTLSDGTFRIDPDQGGDLLWAGSAVRGSQVEYVLRLTGNDIELFTDGVSQGVKDFTGLTLTLDQIGNNTADEMISSVYLVETYNVAVVDPTNITETPDFTLTPDPTTMRTSANANPVLGEDVAKWYADEWSGYRDSRVVFDGGNKFMTGLPSSGGTDSTLVFSRLDITPTGALQYLLKSTDNEATLRINTNNRFVIDDELGSSVSFTYTITASDTDYIFTFDSSNASLYVNSVLQETVSLAGLQFSGAYSLQNSTSSADTQHKELYVYDRKLTQDEINYFSYLRSETGEILLPPLLPS